MINVIPNLSNTLKHWYIPLIIGILFICLGIYIFTVPLETYFTLTLLFTLSFIISGVLEIYFSIANRDELHNWGWYLIGGILNLLLGIYLTIYPGVTIVILPFVIGFNMLFRSLQGLGFSFDLKKLHILSWGNLALLSVAGIILSFVLLAHPIFTGFSLVVLTAITIIVVGVSGIMLSLNLKKLKELPNRAKNI